MYTVHENSLLYTYSTDVEKQQCCVGAETRISSYVHCVKQCTETYTAPCICCRHTIRVKVKRVFEKTVSEHELATKVEKLKSEGVFRKFLYTLLCVCVCACVRVFFLFFLFFFSDGPVYLSNAVGRHTYWPLCQQQQNAYFNRF